MAKHIVNVAGVGTMVKSVRLTLFLEPKEYFELIAEAKALGINAKSDSVLIRKIIHIVLERLPILSMENERLKKILQEKTSVIRQLEEMAESKTKKTKQTKEESKEWKEN